MLLTDRHSLPASDRPYWLAWNQVRGIGPHRMKRLAQTFGSLAAAWSANEQDLMEVEGIGFQLALTIQQERQHLDPEQILIQATKPGIPILTPADPDYPELLWELPDPPPLLYVQGECPRWSPTIAIVGTRKPTPYGQRWTQKLAAALAETGFVIVSGMAEGIDGFAHQACLDAGGITLAVLGTGVDQIYPAKHRQLYHRIQTQGAVISEFPPGTGPAKEHFPRRNRIIAGLCRTTLVMEAPARSGALITGYLANDYSRDIYALPGGIDTPQARGCLDLIDKGASMILGIDELLAALGVPQTESNSEPQSDPAIPLDGDQLTIWQMLSTEPMSLDTIAQATHLEINTLSSALLMMELEGWVIQVPGLRYQRAPQR